MKKAPIALFLLLGICALVAAGCGSGGQAPAAQSGQGSLTFTIAWPEPAQPARLVPAAANSVRVTVAAGGRVVAETVIPKPQTTATLRGIEAGPAVVTATAHASTDGTGAPLATGFQVVVIVAGQSTRANVTLSSTIDRLEIQAQDPATDLTRPLVVNETLPLRAIVRDRNGNALPAGNIVWSSFNESVAQIDNTGRVTARAGGTTVITATETETGRSAALPLRVIVSVSVTPAAVTLTLEQTQPFSAAVAGGASPAVTWSVREGAAGGTITPGGVYTAPRAAGTYHVDACSQVDPDQCSAATVTVVSGGVTIPIQ